jgi:integrase
MANTTKPLTNTEVKQSKPKEKEYNLSDGNGLHLRVKPNGTKLWLFNYSRPYTKRRANLSLGIYPHVSLAEARLKAQEYKSLLAKDIDPKEHRIEHEKKLSHAHINTFEHVAEKWLKLKEESVSHSYQKKINSRLELHVLPRIGKIPLHKINAVNTIDALQPLANQGKMETINNICGWLNEIMTYAVNTGLIHSNPLSGIKKAFSAPKTKHLPTLKPEELPELTEALEKANIRLVTKYLMQWQLHTMVRPREAAEAKWEEIDMDKVEWVIPAEKMKMKRDHTVPLPSQMLALLEKLKSISMHREYLFPSNRSPNKSVNSQTANMALKRMGFKGRLVSHGFRALASTTLNEQGFDPDIIETALAHTDSNTVRAAYNRSEYLERRRVMMQWWSDQIEQATKKGPNLSAREKNIKVANGDKNEF